jgi:hypothetical protein
MDLKAERPSTSWILIRRLARALTSFKAIFTCLCKHEHTTFAAVLSQGSEYTGQEFGSSQGGFVSSQLSQGGGYGAAADGGAAYGASQAEGPADALADEFQVRSAPPYSQKPAPQEILIGGCTSEGRASSPAAIRRALVFFIYNSESHGRCRGACGGWAAVGAGAGSGGRRRHVRGRPARGRRGRRQRRRAGVGLRLLRHRGPRVRGQVRRGRQVVLQLVRRRQRQPHHPPSRAREVQPGAQPPPCGTLCPGSQRKPRKVLIAPSP